MNNRVTSRGSAPRPIDPMDYASRRLSSVVVVAAIFGGVLVAALLETAGLPIVIAVAVGLAPFVLASALATGAARDLRPGSAAGRSKTTTDGAENAPKRLGGWALAWQLGPDAEQTIGRHTGARV